MEGMGGVEGKMKFENMTVSIIPEHFEPPIFLSRSNARRHVVVYIEAVRRSRLILSDHVDDLLL